MVDAAERLRVFMGGLEPPTQETLAHLLGASQVSVSAWLGRRKRPALTFAVAIERATGIPAEEWPSVKVESRGEAA